MYKIRISNSAGKETTGLDGIVDYYMESGWLHMMDRSKSWKHVCVPPELGVEATYVEEPAANVI